jgi:malate dehydrogenase
VVLGKNGIEKILEIELTDAEKAKMQESAAGVRKVNELLDV